MANPSVSDVDAPTSHQIKRRANLVCIRCHQKKVRQVLHKVFSLLTKQLQFRSSVTALQSRVDRSAPIAKPQNLIVGLLPDVSPLNHGHPNPSLIVSGLRDEEGQHSNPIATPHHGRIYSPEAL
jgi:hypothetical protein